MIYNGPCFFSSTEFEREENSTNITGIFYFYGSETPVLSEKHIITGRTEGRTKEG